MSQAATFTTEPFEPRKALLLSSWLARKLPPRDYLLGKLLCTTSRWILYGETGIGKTLFALDIAGSVASGNGLLNWDGRDRSARVMYLDGEMPAETFKERMELIGHLYGPDLKLYGYNRDVLKDGEMPPLNTPEGQKWLWKEIDAVKPNLIVFDSIMCLLSGTIGEEESWTPVKPLVRQISSRRIAQIWLHHTGHDPTKGFGTKTREWEMDTVVSFTKADNNAEAIELKFTKARLRNPQTKEQFVSQIIRRGPDGWISDGSLPPTSAGRSSPDVEHIKSAILAAYDRLADSIAPSPGLNGASVRKVSVNALRDEVKSRGFLDLDEKGRISGSSRKHFQRAKTHLIANNRLIEHDDAIWRP
jgi:hypothetical protein